MELDILNEIFSNTVGDLFRQNNKYNMFSSTLGMRNQVNLNINGKNQGVVRQQQQSGQPLSSESVGQQQPQIKVLQPNQFAYNQMGQQQKLQQQVGKPVGTLGNIQVGSSFSGTNGNLTGANNAQNDNKKLISMSLNSSIQSSLLDQSTNQLNMSKDSIQRGGGVGGSLNTSFNSKNANTNESIIHSQQNVFRDSSNTLRQSNGQFVNNFVGGAQQYPQNNQNFVGNTLNNNFVGTNSNNNIHFNQNQLHQNNINSTHYNQQQQLLQQQNSSQQIGNAQNYQHIANNPKQNGTYINNYTKSSANINNENVQLSPDEWIKMEAPKKLDESMKRLGLDNQRITQRLIKEMNYDQLQTEKKRVKNELKLYDQAFENYFNVQPTRNQKEPMRPLYVYYKGLKQALSKNQNENKPSQSHSTQQQNVSINQGINGYKQQNNNLNIVSASLPSSAQTSVQIAMNSHQSSHNDSFDLHNPNLVSKQNANSLNTSLNGGNNGINPKILQVSNQQPRASSASNRDIRKNNKDLLDKNSYKDIMNIVQEQKENFNNVQGLQQPSLQHPSSQQSLQLNSLNNNYMNNNNNLNSKEQQKVIEQKINFMKRKRVQLREQLQVYQDDFYRTHNRKIKYHKDILPVENEYKEYKDIKKEIIKLEQSLQQQQILV